MTLSPASTADANDAPIPASSGTRAVVAAARDLATRAVDAVLAVVVATSGSTYRKPGAMVLLDARGVRVGALSGGCLEAELEARARDVLRDGIAQEQHFDTSGDEDRVFGSGSGCGGSTRVLLLPLPARASPLRDALLDAEANGCGMALVLAGADAGLGGGIAMVAAPAPARRYAFDRRGAGANEGSVGDAGIRVLIPRAPRLLLLGAGPETPPLLRIAGLLGWRVDLVEHRERWQRFAAGCAVDRSHGEGPDMLPALLERSRFDAALVMNHNFHLDARCLSHLARSDVGHVGLLGPPARRDDLLTDVGEDVAARLRPRLHAPVGLPLGGEGAEAIALSIAAQLQQRFARNARA
jgi:xanthine dehydrogenase accessory factor